MGNDAATNDLNGLLPLLQRLDQLLEFAIAAARLALGPETSAEPYGGTHVTDADTDRLLSREPGAPAFLGYGDIPNESLPDLVLPGSRLEWLQETFGLSNFDLDVVAIALAPELDRRYERLYVYLQDDVRARRPTVDLALNLLCADAATKLARRAHFAAEAPLIHHGLVHLVAEDSQTRVSLLAQELHLDDTVTRFLLGQPGLDRRLASSCQLIQPEAASQTPAWHSERVQSLARLANQAQQTQTPLRLYFQGPDRSAQRHTAEAFAQEQQVPLLVANFARLTAAKDELEQSLHLLFREAHFQQAMVFCDGVEVLLQAEFALAYQTLLAQVANFPNPIILAGTQPWVPWAESPLGIISIPFGLPDVEQRQRLWQLHLQKLGLTLPEDQLKELSSRFRLSGDQIGEAVVTARNRILWQQAQMGSTEPIATTLQLRDLFAAARSLSAQDLTTHAIKVDPHYQWADIVLPADTKAQLREICSQARYRHLVQETWGFNHKLSLGQGLTVLFAGPPGTGKTMAAEVIAHELGLDLYKIDLSQVVSKYIGETEKSLNRIFTAATNANAVLLFDEADALFGKRTEVRDAHDRYANIETSYLLQKMEEYQGIAILTTNLQSNMDEAFVRRLRFIVEFTLPGPAERHRIWQQIWPDEVPCASDLDLEFLAEKLEIPGAVIRNIALRAAYLAAEDTGKVSMVEIMQAVRREYQKMGKILMAEDLNQYGDLLNQTLSKS